MHIDANIACGKLNIWNSILQIAVWFFIFVLFFDYN